MRNHDTEYIQVCRNQVNAAPGITTTQFGPAGHPFQDAAGDGHVIANHMSGIAFDPHHPAPAIFECHLDRDAVMGYNHTFANRIAIGKIGRGSRAGSFVSFYFQREITESEYLNVLLNYQKPYTIIILKRHLIHLLLATAMIASASSSG